MSGADPAMVSVIIAVHNAAAYLAEAIDSALAQTYRPIELIVVDDGSDDGSDEVARRYGRRLTLVSVSHRGTAAARNQALELADGPYLTFLDADDRLPVDSIERRMVSFRGDPGLEAVYGHIREFVSPELEDEARRWLRPPVERVAARLPTSAILRREAMDRVGPFTEALSIGLGIDWGARAAEAGLRSALVPEVCLERRLHTSNTGIREWGSRRQYVHAVKAALDRRRAQS